MRTDVVLLLMGYHESTEYSSQFNQKDVLYDYSYDLENVWQFKVFFLQLYFMAFDVQNILPSYYKIIHVI